MSNVHKDVEPDRREQRCISCCIDIHLRFRSNPENIITQLTGKSHKKYVEQCDKTCSQGSSQNKKRRKYVCILGILKKYKGGK